MEIKDSNYFKIEKGLVYLGIFIIFTLLLMYISHLDRIGTKALEQKAEELTGLDCKYCRVGMCTCYDDIIFPTIMCEYKEYILKRQIVSTVYCPEIKEVK